MRTELNEFLTELVEEEWNPTKVRINAAMSLEVKFLNFLNFLDFLF
jgi:hypothetical protein